MTPSGCRIGLSEQILRLCPYFSSQKCRKDSMRMPNRSAASACGFIPATPPGPSPKLALVLGGGGARAAYQVGILRGMARAFPDLQFPILTGVSAGSINAVHLAACTEAFPESVERLVNLWRSLTMDQVVCTDLSALVKHMLHWALRLMSGGGSLSPTTRGLVDTAPLRLFLLHALDSPDGLLRGIETNLLEKRLDAIGISTTNYANGQSITWAQGRDIHDWNRPGRRSQLTRLTVDHIMASCALPMFFPAVQIGPHWHGDGGVQLTAPLSPALHLGAERIIAISNRYMPTQLEAEALSTNNYPPPATVLGVLLNAIFLDMLDYDALSMRRINELIRSNPLAPQNGLRPVELLLLRPSQDLGVLANEFEKELPRAFRFLTRGLGTRETQRADLLATILFLPAYIDRVIAIGEADAFARRSDLAAFLGYRVADAPAFIHSTPPARHAVV